MPKKQNATKSLKDQATAEEEEEYRAWKRSVSAICQRRFALHLSDLPDMLTRDAFDERISPEEFFEEDVMRMMHEEYGDLIDELEDE